LSKDELLDYVFKNVQQHLREAKEKNTQLFVLIDTNQDGKILKEELNFFM
jgi:Ca2+-binding EF-hand superfamily protein